MRQFLNFWSTSVTSLITSNIMWRNQLCHLSTSFNFKMWHFIYRK